MKSQRYCSSATSLDAADGAHLVGGYGETSGQNWKSRMPDQSLIAAVAGWLCLFAGPAMAQSTAEPSAGGGLSADRTAEAVPVTSEPGAWQPPAPQRVAVEATAPASSTTVGKAAEPTQPPLRTRTLRARLVAEFGFLDPLYHRIQFGSNGTEFDYVKDGGQDVLFPTMRFSLEGSFKKRHSLILLYQPLDLRTEETLRQDLVVDDLVFPAGTAINFRYGFDFYRLSYLYNLLSCRDDCELSVGASLQLRNAVIDFTSADGALRRSNRDVGPVPALKSRGRLYLGEAAWLGYEVDGMYAPVKYINGGKSDVVGAILDFSIRGGYDVARSLGVFVNLRYLGGGAEGTSKSDAARGPGDGYSSNWLHFMTWTAGFEVKLEQLSAGQ